MEASPAQIEPTPAQRRWGDLGVRAVSGLALVAVAIVTARLGGVPFLAVWLFAAIAVLFEWQRLAGAPAGVPGLVVGIIALVAAALLSRTNPGGALVTLVAAAIVLVALAGPGRRLWAGAGMVYAGLLVVAVVALHWTWGSRVIFWLFATVWSTDVFAYFGGRLIGGPKLWPRVSPSKTWSGTFTGVVAGAAIGTIAAPRDLLGFSSLVSVLAMGLAAAVLSQAGDAFESAMKRHFGVKDSGTLIPGHGGVMDRLDGFVAAAVFALLVGLARGLPSVAGGIFYWP